MVSYLVVADELEQGLMSASAGDPVPSETELARQYRLSRLTARAALQELERRHLVRRIQGRGTFVLRRLDYHISPEGPASFTEIVGRAGGTASTTNERTSVRVATAEEQTALRLSARARVVEVNRRRWLGGEPVGVAKSVLPSELFPGLGRRLGPAGSLYRAMVDDYQMDPKRAWFRSEVRTAPPDVARLLDLRTRLELFHNEGRLESTRLQRPIEINDGWLRTDVFNVVVEIGAFQ